MSMVMLNEELNAKEALEIGLVYKLIDSNFTEKVTKEIQSIARMPSKVSEAH